MNKVYSRINWKNYPSVDTAVNESNLNRMDYAIDEIDKRVVEYDTTKANVASLNELINSWHIDETTGVITITKVSGEQIIFDLNIEKVPVGFSMTEDGILIMTTDDGTEFTANIGSMIPILTFEDTEEIAVSVSGEGVNKTYSFAIKTGSIAEDKLQPNFLADCRLYAGNAENSATLAGEYAEQAKESAESVSGVSAQVNANTEAIGIINSTITPKYKTTASVTVNVATNTKTITAQLPLTKGLWYVNANARWEKGSATGFRYILVSTSAESGAGQASHEAGMNMLIDTIPGIATNAITHIAKGIMRILEDSTLYMYVYQNSGSAMDVGYNMLSAYKLSENVV